MCGAIINKWIVFKERIYKIWKQFTTCLIKIDKKHQLCSKNEYTKSESNSQHLLRAHISRWNCVQRTNIQNLKAIHNAYTHKNSRNRIVFKERIYKIWKQFTTAAFGINQLVLLCSKNEYTKSESNSQLGVSQMMLRRHCVQRTNIQNLKAIHNAPAISMSFALIVFKERIYKIWKQFTTAAQPYG